jgi:hypothetical protein
LGVRGGIEGGEGREEEEAAGGGEGVDISMGESSRTKIGELAPARASTPSKTLSSGSPSIWRSDGSIFLA